MAPTSTLASRAPVRALRAAAAGPRRVPRRTAPVRAQAEPPVVPNVPAPKGVTQPPLLPVQPPAKFGFVENAERLNSRAAMLGFFGILIVEAVTGKGIFEMAGLKIGNGLGFEF